MGRLRTFDSQGPVTLTQGGSSYVFFSIPLNSAIIERMLEIRDKDGHVAFKINLTIAAIYYHKQQDERVISDILQAQGLLWERHLFLIPLLGMSILVV
jgi:hypothetical protein